MGISLFPYCVRPGWKLQGSQNHPPRPVSICPHLKKSISPMVPRCLWKDQSYCPWEGWGPAYAETCREPSNGAVRATESNTGRITCTTLRRATVSTTATPLRALPPEVPVKIVTHYRDKIAQLLLQHQGLQEFPVKDQRVNVFSFVSHMDTVATT